MPEDNADIDALVGESLKKLQKRIKQGYINGFDETRTRNFLSRPATQSPRLGQSFGKDS